MRLKLSKRVAVVAASPLLMLLVAGARLSVFPVPDTLAPDPSTRLHEQFQAKPGDVILRGRILRTQSTFVDAPVKVSIARFSDSIAAGDELTPVLAPSATNDLLGVHGIYYCGPDQRARSGFAAAMIGDLGSKFESIVRFCFIDSDGDRKLDKVFLAGAKDKEFQAPVAITPTAFHSTYLTRLHDSDEIRVRYHKFSPDTGKIQLVVELIRDGHDEPFDYILSMKDRVADRQYRMITTNPKKLAYPLHFTDILGADIGIEGVNPDGSGTATFVINHGFPIKLFKPVSIQVQTIYVYIYH